MGADLNHYTLSRYAMRGAVVQAQGRHIHAISFSLTESP